MASIAAAGPGNSLFVGLQTGHLAKSVGLGELWSQFAEGTPRPTRADDAPGPRPVAKVRHAATLVPVRHPPR